MKNFWIILSISFMLLVTKANADVRFGLSAAFTQIEADGSETEGGEKTTASVSNDVIIPSIFVEFSGERFGVGLDYIPLDADVSNKTKSRTDVETSVTGTTTTTSTSRTQKAQAEISDHFTLYATMALTDTFYLKGGMAQFSLNTNESLGTGSKYGNVDVDGIVYGFGFTDGNSRLELAYTDYEDISLTSTVARTGVTTNNKISADLDTLSLKYSYAF